MATKTKGSGGANADSSGGAGGSGSADGSGNADDNSGDDDAGTATKTVPLDTYQKAVTEAKNRQKRLDELAAENKALKDAQAEKDRKALEDQGQYKTLLEQEREAHKASKELLNAKDGEIKTFKEKETDRRKFSALTKAVGVSIPTEYAPLIDWDAMAVDPETGEVDTNSVTRYAEAFRNKYPAIIVAQKGTGQPHGKQAGNKAGSGKISWSDWEKLPTAEARKYKSEDIIE